MWALQCARTAAGVHATTAARQTAVQVGSAGKRQSRQPHTFLSRFIIWPSFCCLRQQTSKI